MMALGLLAARFVAVPDRDAWWLIAQDADTNVVVARISVTNTGLFAREAVTRLAVLPPRSTVVEHRAVLGPGTLDENGIAVATDRLAREPGGWALDVGGAGLRARLRLQGADVASCPPTAGAAAGMVQDGSAAPGAPRAGQGFLIDGRGVMVRTRARGTAGSGGLYVLAADVQVGIDPLAACPAWLRVGEESWTGAPPAVPAAGPFSVVMGGHTLTVRPTGSAVVQDPFGHLLPPERILAWLAGYPSPKLRLQRALVQISGLNGRRHGLVLGRG
jgi:hypothetical protein